MSIRNRFYTLVLISLLAFLGFSACDMENGGVNSPSNEKFQVRTATEKIEISWNNPTGLLKTIVKVKNNNNFLIDILVFYPEVNTFDFTAEEGGYYKFDIQFLLDDGSIVDNGEKRAFLLKSDLPIIYINTPEGVPINTKEWLNKSKGLGLSTFAIENAGEHNLPSIYTDIRGRGNSTWGMPKKPYNLSLDSKEGLLGFSKHKKWVLLANYSDKSLLRTEFAFNLGNNIFDNLSWTPGAKSVELVLNGEYVGVYQLVEKIEFDKNRLDIKANKNDYAAGDFLLEIDARLDQERHFKTTAGMPITFKDPDTLSDEEFATMKSIVQNLEDVITTGDYEVYKEYLDVDSFIDWYLVNELTKNVDSKQFSSIYLYYVNSEAKFFMGPLWDFDISSGNVNYSGCDNETGFYVKEGPWYRELFKDATFQSKVQERWNYTKGDVLTAIGNIAIMSEALEIGQSNNFQRWEILGKYVWPNRVWPETYKEEIEELTSWLTTRYNWLDTNFNLL